MDVFDDIIDHSYDAIEDPEQRLRQAINLNKDLLTDINKVKQLWKDNRNRFVNNVNFARNTLYEFYSNRAEKMMLSALSIKS